MTLARTGGDVTGNHITAAPRPATDRRADTAPAGCAHCEHSTEVATLGELSTGLAGGPRRQAGVPDAEARPSTPADQTDPEEVGRMTSAPVGVSAHRPRHHRGLTLDECAAMPATIDISTAAQVLGIGRSAAYELVRCGQWPTPVLRLGKLIRIPTKPLLELLGDQRG
jgi:hypothetical protein